MRNMWRKRGEDAETIADRIVKTYGETQDALIKRIEEKDKRRKVYYKYYTDRQWGMSQNYHITLDSGVLGLKTCRDIILELARRQKMTEICGWSIRRRISMLYSLQDKKSPKGGMIMRLRLQKARQAGEYYYTGYVSLPELADSIEGYIFEPEVLEKAKIHKKNMEMGIPAFAVTFRMEPASAIEEEGDALLFESSDYEIRDGKSRAAAVLFLDRDQTEGYGAAVKVFLVSKEKMDKLEKNQL